VKSWSYRLTRYAEMVVTVSEINSDDMNKTTSKRLRRLPVTINNDFL